MFLHIFGHVHPDQCVLRAEHSFRQSLAQLCLSHACGPQKQEGTDRPFGIFQPYPAAADGSGHGRHGLVLSHDSLDLFPSLLLLFLNVSCFLVGFRLDGGFLLPLQGLDLLLQLFDLGRLHKTGKSQLGGSLIDQVDGFIRKETVVDVSGGHLYCRFQSLVGNPDSVVVFIAAPEPFQNLISLLLRRLFHGHGLETTLQRGIFLNIFAVFLDGGSPDQLNLSSGQGRF